MQEDRARPTLADDVVNRPQHIVALVQPRPHPRVVRLAVPAQVEGEHRVARRRQRRRQAQQRVAVAVHPVDADHRPPRILSRHPPAAQGELIPPARRKLHLLIGQPKRRRPLAQRLHLRIQRAPSHPPRRPNVERRQDRDERNPQLENSCRAHPPACQRVLSSVWTTARLNALPVAGTGTSAVNRRP